MQPCEACATGKDDKKIKKESEHVLATKTNKRVFWYILTINNLKNGKDATLKTKNWRITVDAFIRIKFYCFYDTNNRMIEQAYEKLGK